MKNILTYPAVFRKEDLGFSVEFIDIPGAITQGDDLKEAEDMAKDVLYLTIQDYICLLYTSDAADDSTEV